MSALEPGQLYATLLDAIKRRNIFDVLTARTVYWNEADGDRWNINGKPKFPAYTGSSASFNQAVSQIKAELKWPEAEGHRYTDAYFHACDIIQSNKHSNVKAAIAFNRGCKCHPEAGKIFKMAMADLTGLHD